LAESWQILNGSKDIIGKITPDCVLSQS